MSNLASIKIYLALVFIISAVIIAMMSTKVETVGNRQEGYVSNTGGSVEVQTPSGSCVTIINTSGKNYFVPTKSQTEWDRFRNTGLSSISIIYSCSTYAWQQGGWSTCSVTCRQKNTRRTQDALYNSLSNI